jgi:hypothetical protein
MQITVSEKGETHENLQTRFFSRHSGNLFGIGAGAADEK